MSLNQQIEEKQVSEAQELQIPNCITFNGKINSQITDVGGGYMAFELIGKKGEEFPLLLLKSTPEQLANNFLEEGDLVAGIGILVKVQDQWTIQIMQINRIPTEEEIKHYK